MPYGECPVCGEQYHLRVGDAKAWYEDRGLAFRETLKEKCYGCWKELSEYDVVKVISVPKDVVGVEIGDTGAVLMIHKQENDNLAYEVESVLPDGSNKWLGTFRRENLWYDFKSNKVE